MRIRARLAIFGAIATLSCSAAQAGGPSFSCARASTPDERAICRSPALSEADAQLRSLYHEIHDCYGLFRIRKNDPYREWLSKEARCGGNSACLNRFYRVRIAEFTPQASEARKLMQENACPGQMR